MQAWPTRTIPISWFVDHWHVTNSKSHIECISIISIVTAATAQPSVKNNECGSAKCGCLSVSCYQKDTKKTRKQGKWCESDNDLSIYFPNLFLPLYTSSLFERHLLSISRSVSFLISTVICFILSFLNSLNHKSINATMRNVVANWRTNTSNSWANSYKSISGTWPHASPIKLQF